MKWTRRYAFFARPSEYGDHPIKTDARDALEEVQAAIVDVEWEERRPNAGDDDEEAEDAPGDEDEEDLDADLEEEFEDFDLE